MVDAEDKDDDSFRGAFEDGQWVWDDNSHSLIFLLNHPEVEEAAVAVAPKVLVVGEVQFRELDLIEQMRFRKRYQRKLKPGQADVISLQDVKDLAIFTAPNSIMSSALIKVLHLPTTERFLRALIFYCQYYLQIAGEMTERMAVLERKIRTPVSFEIESEFRNDLRDLRCLVTKEYSTMLIGGQDTKKYHHMGPDKKKKSLSDKDARFFESLLLFAIQIVWIALGRRSYNQLELEIHRLFKTDRFNSAEHKLKTNYYKKLSAEEHSVLLGDCLHQESKVFSRSPLLQEFICPYKIDYRMFGLGTISYDILPQRLGYLLMVLTAPEEELGENRVSLGILGLPRSNFDTSLHLLPSEVKQQSKASKHGSQKTVREPSRASESDSSKKPSHNRTEKLYGYKDIVLPEKCPGEPPYPPSFPEDSAKPRHCNDRQRKLWINRLYRLLHAHDRFCSEFTAHAN